MMTLGGTLSTNRQQTWMVPLGLPTQGRLYDVVRGAFRE